MVAGAIVALALYICFIPLPGVPVKAMEAVSRSKNRKLFRRISCYLFNVRIAYPSMKCKSLVKDIKRAKRRGDINGMERFYGNSKR